MIEITHRFTNKVIYASKTALTIKIAVEDAVKEKANLSGANLSWANLSRADLSEANLSGADLSWANLSEANLSEANLLFCKMDKTVLKQITKGWFEWTIVD